MREKGQEREVHRRAYKIPEIAARNGLSQTTIKAEIRSGRLRARKVRKSTIIFDEDEEAWRQALPVRVPTTAA